MNNVGVDISPNEYISVDANDGEEYYSKGNL